MIYETIKKMCKARGLSLHKLEVLAGLSNGTIASWQKSSPRLRSLERIAQVLDVPVERLLRSISEGAA